MAIRDLIPWNQSRNLATRRDDEMHPFMTLHREMNRMFDDVFRRFDLAPFRRIASLDRLSWPSIDVDQDDKSIRVTAELPGLEEKDVRVEVTDGVLAISGEKKNETKHDNRLFSERFYGRFERRIPLDAIDEDRIDASFKNGVLSVTLPKTDKPRENVKRIAINKT